MKATKFLYSLAVLGVSATLVFSACKKKEDKEPENPATPTQPETQSGTDNREVQNENDQSISDINDAISNNKFISGRSMEGASPTGSGCYQVDTIKLSHDTLLIKYNGQTCMNRTRTGTIRLSWIHGTKWKNANAMIKVDYLSYKVERASDHKFFILNGTQYVTNVNGGTWLDFFLGQPIVNKVTGSNLQVTFEDNKTAVYNINRQVTYTYAMINSQAVITAKAEGIGSQGSLHNLENFGTARNGDAFTSQVSTPIIWNTTCGGAVIQGVVNVVNTTQNASLSFTYGVDINGNPQPVGPNACPYGWKLQWTYNGGSGSSVIAYQ
jgi:hypothetical protein